MAASILVTGGARSGKSGFAQAWCTARPGQRSYIATAGLHPHDEEMQARIHRHRQDRAASFASTWEAPLHPVAAIASAVSAGAAVALVDCVTLWVSNLAEHHAWDEGRVLAAVDGLAALLAQPPLDLAVVTNEVGDGIVPDHAAARRFRDLQGWANQRLAGAAQQVALVVCGLPWWLKGDPSRPVPSTPAAPWRESFDIP